MIWSDVAIDYSKGVDIIDPITGKIYTQDEATLTPNEVKRRLTLKGRVIGCYVYTLEEIDEIQKRTMCKNN